MTDAIELIEWLDHCSLGGGRTWQPRSDVEELEPIKVRSVGWVIKEGEDALTMISHQHADEVYGELIIIKSCIKTRRVLVAKRDVAPFRHVRPRG